MADYRIAKSGVIPARKPRRLMLLSTNMAMGGGAEEQVIHLACAFQKRGWKTMIVSLLPPGVMPPDFASHGIPLLDLGMKRAIPDPRAISRLAALIRQFRPDVVHAHMPQANLLARAARLMEPYPVLVNTLHALTMAGVNCDRKKLLQLAHRLTDRLCDRTTAICHAAADYYVQARAVPSAKMMVVPNGIDTARFHANAAARRRLRREFGLDGQFVWLSAGRLENVKAYPVLLRAFARLGEGSRSLLICGDGSLREKLVHLADQLNIGLSVKFMGLRSDMPDMMSAADGFALSSDSEGLPLVLLQAAAAGLPMVATDVGGNSEIVREGITGFLTPAGNDEAFANLMRRVELLTSAEHVAIGQAGEKRAQTMFDLTAVADQWERLFIELLEGPCEEARIAPIADNLATRTPIGLSARLNRPVIFRPAAELVPARNRR